jgi:hypothetical protein
MIETGEGETPSFELESCGFLSVCSSFVLSCRCTFILAVTNCKKILSYILSI